MAVYITIYKKIFSNSKLLSKNVCVTVAAGHVFITYIPIILLPTHIVFVQLNILQ